MSADQGSGKADQGSEGSTGEGMQFSIGAQVSCSDEVFGELAARAVGSRSSYEIECARTDRLAVWAAQTQSRRPTRRLLPARRRSVSLHGRPIDALGTDAVRAISEHTDQTRAAALALVDELLAIGVPERDCAATLQPSAQPLRSAP